MSTSNESDQPNGSEADERLAAWSREVLGAPVEVDPATAESQIARALAELGQGSRPAPVARIGQQPNWRRALAAAAAVVVVGGVAGLILAQPEGRSDDSSSETAADGSTAQPEAAVPSVGDDGSAGEEPASSAERIDLGAFATVAQLRAAVAATERFELRDADAMSEAPLPEAADRAPAVPGDDCGLAPPLGAAVVAGRSVLVELAPGASGDAPPRVVDATTCEELG